MTWLFAWHLRSFSPEKNCCLAKEKEAWFISLNVWWRNIKDKLQRGNNRKMRKYANVLACKDLKNTWPCCSCWKGSFSFCCYKQQDISFISQWYLFRIPSSQHCLLLFLGFFDCLCYLVEKPRGVSQWISFCRFSSHRSFLTWKFLKHNIFLNLGVADWKECIRLKGDLCGIDFIFFVKNFKSCSKCSSKF